MVYGDDDLVGEMLRKAPSYETKPHYLDHRIYKMNIQSQSFDTSTEERWASPLAIAVNIGNVSILNLIVFYMHNVEYDRGLKVYIKEKALDDKQKIFAVER